MCPVIQILVFSHIRSHRWCLLQSFQYLQPSKSAANIIGKLHQNHQVQWVKTAIQKVQIAPISSVNPQTSKSTTVRYDNLKFTFIDLVSDHSIGHFAATSNMKWIFLFLSLLLFVLGSHSVLLMVTWLCTREQFVESGDHLRFQGLNPGWSFVHQMPYMLYLCSDPEVNF